MVTIMNLAMRGNGDKGSFRNRVDCAVAQSKNDAAAYLKEAGVYGAVGAAGYVAMKNPNKFAKVANSFASYVGKGLNTFAEGLPKKTIKLPAAPFGKGGTKTYAPTEFFSGAANTIKKVADAITKNPKTALAVAAGVVAAGVLQYIHTRHAFTAGQIDQKYTDKAAMAE